ncbi:MAG: recombinase family protein [Porticoccus sp.]
MLQLEGTTCSYSGILTLQGKPRALEVIKAYSYLRFSSETQKKGNSTARQNELIQDYLDKNPDLTLVESYKDLGLSGYHAKNKSDGELGVFLELVKDGKIPKGSYLLVEALDRLSREAPRKAMNSFSEIIDAGINLVTLSDNKLYSYKSLDDQPFELFGSLLLMVQAHEESKRKGQRVSKAWKAKRERARADKTPYSKRCPAWIKLTNNKYELIPERVSIVQRVFDLTEEGRGKEYIHRKLNEEGLKPFGSSTAWGKSSVIRLMNNIAVYGAMQPKFTERADGKVKSVEDGEPIEDFYPAIMTKKEFMRIQGLRRRTQTTGRKGTGLSNILGGLVFCNVCNSPVTYYNKGGKGNKYLQCSSARAKAGCTAKAVVYDPVEKAVITAIGYVDISPIIKEANESNEAEILVAEEELEQISEKLSKFQAQYEETPTKTALKVIAGAEIKQDELIARLKELNEQPVIRKNLLADLKRLGNDLTSEDEDIKFKARTSVKVLLSLYFSKLLISPEWVNESRNLGLVSKSQKASFKLKIERSKLSRFDNTKKAPISSLTYSYCIYDRNNRFMYRGAGFLNDYVFIDPEDFSDLSDFPEEDLDSDIEEFDILDSK